MVGTYFWEGEGMTTIDELNSDRALVCKQEHHSDAGGATIWYVLLKDAHLLDCGFGFKAEERAKGVAAAINAATPTGEPSCK